jgi:L-serine dehydratase
MSSAHPDIPYPRSFEFDTRSIEPQLRIGQQMAPVAFSALKKIGLALGLSPAALALALEALELSDRSSSDVSPRDVWQEAVVKYVTVMRTAVRRGTAAKNDLTFLGGDWAFTLAPVASMLGVGWHAFVAAIAVQERNAAHGLISAAPTGGASGTLPGTIIAVSDALGLPEELQIEALLVGGLVGRVAFGRGPVSGAQAGCGGEIGIAAAMAAGAVAHLLGGSWSQIDAAGALAATPFIGVECSPAFGLVEYPCVPRNGFATLCAIAAAEAACAGIVPPYSMDYTFDAVFGVGRLLPPSLRETENRDWTQTAQAELHGCTEASCENCKH